MIHRGHFPPGEVSPAAGADAFLGSHGVCDHFTLFPPLFYQQLIPRSKHFPVQQLVLVPRGCEEFAGPRGRAGEGAWERLESWKVFFSGSRGSSRLAAPPLPRRRRLAGVQIPKTKLVPFMFPSPDRLLTTHLISEASEPEQELMGSGN